MLTEVRRCVPRVVSTVCALAHSGDCRPHLAALDKRIESTLLV